MGDVIYIADYLERKRERAWIRFEYEGGTPPDLTAWPMVVDHGFVGMWQSWDDAPPADPVSDILAFQAHVSGASVTSVHHDEVELAGIKLGSAGETLEELRKRLPNVVFHVSHVDDKEPPESGS